MKFIRKADTETRAANPTPEALGFDLQKELAAACKTALKPIQKQLRHFCDESERLKTQLQRWTDEAFDNKLREIAGRAQSGDEQAAIAIEEGALPSRESYAKMHSTLQEELDKLHSDHRATFAEAARLIEGPMTSVVDKAQAILDRLLDGLGVASFELHGARNAVGFMVLQLEMKSRGESCDLGSFWQAAG
jgi:hypothetical protein